MDYVGRGFVFLAFKIYTEQGHHQYDNFIMNFSTVSCSQLKKGKILLLNLSSNPL